MISRDKIRCQVRVRYLARILWGNLTEVLGRALSKMLARHVHVLSQHIIVRWVSETRIIMRPEVKSMRPVKAHAQGILRKWMWLIPE